MDTKVCKKCGIEKPLDQFSTNRQARDGKINNCKPCETARVKSWTIANPDKVKAWNAKGAENNLRTMLSPDTLKKCSKCGVTKPISEFGDNTRNKFNVRASCKECNVEHAMKNYWDEPEKYRAKSAKWREENPEKYEAYMTKYMDEHRDERNEYRRLHRLDNIEHERERDREYTRNNLVKFRIKNGKRRAAKNAATPSWLTLIHLAQIEEFYEMAEAKTMQTGIPHEVDHMVPLLGKTVRGLHVPWNLQILTDKENISKKNKLLPEHAELSK
jgi:hypothetical protein